MPSGEVRIEGCGGGLGGEAGECVGAGGRCGWRCGGEVDWASWRSRRWAGAVAVAMRRTATPSSARRRAVASISTAVKAARRLCGLGRCGVIVDREEEVDGRLGGVVLED